MNLLYIADNGFSVHDGKYYCTAPNRINIEQYKKYFSQVHVIARKSRYQEGTFLIEDESKVVLIPKNHFLSLYRAMKDLSNSYDIVLMRNGINGCFAGIFARKLKKTTIAYCGSDPFDFQRTRKGFFRRYILAPIWGRFERNKMADADYSQYCTSYLYKKYPTRHPYLICSNVDVEIDENDYFDRIKKIDGQSMEKKIGMIGQADERKGVRTIIRALARLGKTYRFEMIGGGNPELFEDEIEDLAVSEQISFLGYCTDRNKMKMWLKGIDIYIQPSLAEGLPRSTIEAMAMACPCVATDIAGLPDLLENDYLISPGDDAALAEKIKWLSDNSEAAKKAAKKNFEKAKEFRRDVRDRKLDGFYGGIVNAVSAGGR